MTDAQDELFPGVRVALLAAAPGGAGKGGAERLFEGLHAGLTAIGCKAELVVVRCDEPDHRQIMANYRTVREMDLSGFDVVVSTKVPTYAARHPNHVLLLMHTVRVYDDMFDDTFPTPSTEQLRERASVHAADFEALSGVKALFSQSYEVARRLYKWRGLRSDVIHPPLAFDGFRKGQTGDYLFLPGRLHPWKRVHLVIDAIRSSKLPIRFLIAGTGEAQADLMARAQGDPRIEFLGRIDDDELVRLYANALAVPFVPIREDYGYITLEAFASGKAVVTCSDSGEPNHFVRQGQTGLVCEPDAASLRDAFEWLYAHREEAAEMGRRGSAMVASMSWRRVAAQLVRAALAPAPTVPDPTLPVSVLDMQPIDPPVGGGRLRLLGLYHGLGSTVRCRYVGTYDWPGEPFRQHALSGTLTETDVPLSDAHFAAAAELSRKANGKGVIDIAFSRQAHLSPDFVAAAREAVHAADVAVFSHPWVFPLVRDCLRSDQVVVYESHNVEGFLRAQLLDDGDPAEAALLRGVVEDEYAAGRRADWILACSHEDLLRFNRVFGFDPGKMRVVPNGVMAFDRAPATPAERRAARAQLGLAPDAFVAIFVGSGYGPNVEAADFIDHELAPLLPDATLVVAGGVGEGMKARSRNVVVTGRLSEPDKLRWFQASDIGINPMRSGSGTNIKMFDFMAMALPVVSTGIGARGIETAGQEVMSVAAPDAQAFADAIERMKDPAVRERIGRAARACVEDGYAWERISDQLGAFLAARQRFAGQARPLFSVVVPTYERHHQLDELVGFLRAQVERDFEVVLVDQSAAPWEGAGRSHGFPLTYHHTPVKGAVRARNTGAMLAQGEIIAFVDDDCQPDEAWLLNARRRFAQSSVVGIEGLIHSDHHDDPDWRPVTNVGFEGIGFMTANLMVRSSVFQFLGGFDLQFDRPHFREDTDFGWRMQDLGDVPYAEDVRVFHPAQRRDKVRESAPERARFFVKDALLWRKHPERYRALFMAERHFERTPGFAEHLRRGFDEGAMAVPDWIERELVAAGARRVREA